MLTEFAPAKVNLFLHVDQVKPNGRHDLQSLVVFATDTAADELSFLVGGDAFSLEMKQDAAEHEHVAEEDNLVLKAARALLSASGSDGSGKFCLDKKLPIAAGIGGGSSDAAAAMRLLNRAFGIDQSFARQVAPSLGGDVPVALASTAAEMAGEGERVSPIELPAPIPAVLVNPKIACPTGAIFSAYDEAGGGKTFEPVVIPMFETMNDCVAWCATQRNDLEAPALSLLPEIGDVLEMLSGLTGVQLARMSGSGATCFALFETLAMAQDAEAILKRTRPDWWIRCTMLS